MKTLLIVFLHVIFASTAPITEVGDNIKWCKGKPADIFFLLDSSSSIWIKDYKRQLKFVSEVIDIFDISPNKTMVGVGIFSDRFEMGIKFNTYDNKTNLQEAVLKTRYLKGNTFTHTALENVNDIFKGARRNVAHIAIVMTDGKSRNKKLTLRQAENLHKAGIYVFAIGIGKHVDEDELQAIGSGEGFVYRVDKFKLLNKIRETLAMQACKVEVSTPPPMDQPSCSPKSDTDVMFILDSAAMGLKKSQTVYTFISEVSEEIVTDEDRIKVGVMSKNCYDNNIYFNEYNEKQRLISRLRNFDFKGLDHQVHKMANKQLMEEIGGRSDSKKMAVLFIDENTVKYDTLILAAEKAKNESNIEIFVVAIGDNIDFEACGRIASPHAGNHVIKVSSHKDLGLLKDDFLLSFCQNL